MSSARAPGSVKLWQSPRTPLRADLNRTWARQSITSDAVSDVGDVANTLLSQIANARRTPLVRTETVRIVPRPEPSR